MVVLHLTKGKIGNTLMMGVPIILSESEIFRKHPTFCSLVICWLHDCQTIGTSCLPDGLVRMRSAVRIRPAAPKSIENFGFLCFFVAKMLKEVRGKMWVNRLTHTVTHTGKYPDRSKEYRR